MAQPRLSTIQKAVPGQPTQRAQRKQVHDDRPMPMPTARQACRQRPAPESPAGSQRLRRA